MKYIFIIAAFLCASGAHADASLPGWAAYVAGDFITSRSEAHKSGVASNNADAFALACRSGLVVGGFLETGKAAVKSLHRALKDCEKALAINPDNYVAGLSHAIAIGFEGLRLRKASYARASKREIERLIDKYPQNALALGALAGWHAAVVREGWFAQVFLGGSKRRADTLYAAAMELPNAELPLVYEYIRFLAANNTIDQQRAADLVRRSVKKGANDGFDALLLERCTAILQAIGTQSRKQIRASVAAATPFYGIDTWGRTRVTQIEAYPLRKRTSTSDD